MSNVICFQEYKRNKQQYVVSAIEKSPEEIMREILMSVCFLKN